MVCNDHRGLADVVCIIAFRKLVAESGRGVLHARAVASLVGCVRRIYFNAYCISAGRNDGLAIATVQDEVLATQFEDVGIGPAIGNALVAITCHRTAVAIVPGSIAG